MNPLEAYMARSSEIIDDRTSAERKYDSDVLKGLQKGKGIVEAVEAANQKHPTEALNLDGENVDNVAAHYDYLLEHERIAKKLAKLRKGKKTQ